jgi:hypothetical protein
MLLFVFNAQSPKGHKTRRTGEKNGRVNTAMDFVFYKA